MATLLNKVKNLAQSPGIYKMLDKEGKVIYVGKAKNLRNRVKSYFQKGYEHSTRTRKLVECVRDLSTVETDTELEALILENNLIKELRPRYNILMKDDKSYVYIKVDLGEDFPRIRIIREHQLQQERGVPRDKVKYFGPKLASSKVYETLRILKKLFPFRHCQLDIKWKGDTDSANDYESLPVSPNEAHSAMPRRDIPRGPLRGAVAEASPEVRGEPSLTNKNLVEVKNRVIDFPCLDYYIKRCNGPCIGAISPVAYKKIVHQITDFLSGKSDTLETSLNEQMMEAAEKKLFEKAARLRDKLKSIQSIREQQKINDPNISNTDVINFTTDMGHVYFNVFMIRGGKMIGKENFMLDAPEMKEKDSPTDLAEVMESFLKQYYEKAMDIPCEILIPSEVENKEPIEKWLTEKGTGRVHIIAPQKGKKNKLLELSLKNAVSFASQYRIKWLAEKRGETALKRLAEVIGFGDKTPKRIEGYDISHLGGDETVGSMVVFKNGASESSHYRHFKIRTVVGKPDDYRSMEEVLMRRLKYLKNEKMCEGIKIKMPGKKDFELMKKLTEGDPMMQFKGSNKDFLVAKKGEKIVGFGAIFKLNEKVSVISKLWVAPAERGKKLGYEIMKKLIDRSKLKRVYIDTTSELEEYYSAFGFTMLHKPLPVLVARLKEIKNILRKQKKLKKVEIIYMVYDSKKYKADPSFSEKPDLIVIDGGKGQLSTAVLVLKRLKLEIPVISLAKRLEEIFIPGNKAPILLDEGDEALKLLERIRDESHRFAITFQRNLHRKALINK